MSGYVRYECVEKPMSRHELMILAELFRPGIGRHTMERFMSNRNGPVTLKSLFQKGLTPCTMQNILNTKFKKHGFPHHVLCVRDAHKGDHYRIFFKVPPAQQ